MFRATANVSLLTLLGILTEGAALFHQTPTTQCKEIVREFEAQDRSNGPNVDDDFLECQKACQEREKKCTVFALSKVTKECVLGEDKPKKPEGFKNPKGFRTGTCHYAARAAKVSVPKASQDLKDAAKSHTATLLDLWEKVLAKPSDLERWQDYNKAHEAAVETETRIAEQKKAQAQPSWLTFIEDSFLPSLAVNDLKGEDAPDQFRRQCRQFVGQRLKPSGQKLAFMQDSSQDACMQACHDNAACEQSVLHLPTKACTLYTASTFEKFEGKYDASEYISGHCTFSSGDL